MYRAVIDSHNSGHYVGCMKTKSQSYLGAPGRTVSIPRKNKQDLHLLWVEKRENLT